MQGLRSDGSLAQGRAGPGHLPRVPGANPEMTNRGRETGKSPTARHEAYALSCRPATFGRRQFDQDVLTDIKLGNLVLFRLVTLRRHQR